MGAGEDQGVVGASLASRGSRWSVGEGGMAGRAAWCRPCRHSGGRGRPIFRNPPGSSVCNYKKVPQ